MMLATAAVQRFLLLCGIAISLPMVAANIAPLNYDRISDMARLPGYDPDDPSLLAYQFAGDRHEAFVDIVGPVIVLNFTQSPSDDCIPVPLDASLKHSNFITSADKAGALAASQSTAHPQPPNALKWGTIALINFPNMIRDSRCSSASDVIELIPMHNKMIMAHYEGLPPITVLLFSTGSKDSQMEFGGPLYFVTDDYWYYRDDAEHKLAAQTAANNSSDNRFNGGLELMVTSQPSMAFLEAISWRGTSFPSTTNGTQPRALFARISYRSGPWNDYFDGRPNTIFFIINMVMFLPPLILAVYLLTMFTLFDNCRISLQALFLISGIIGLVGGILFQPTIPRSSGELIARYVMEWVRRSILSGVMILWAQVMRKMDNALRRHPPIRNILTAVICVSWLQVGLSAVYYGLLIFEATGRNSMRHYAIFVVSLVLLPLSGLVEACIYLVAGLAYYKRVKECALPCSPAVKSLRRIVVLSILLIFGLATKMPALAFSGTWIATTIAGEMAIRALLMINTFVVFAGVVFLIAFEGTISGWKKRTRIGIGGFGKRRGGGGGGGGDREDILESPTRSIVPWAAAAIAPVDSEYQQPQSQQQQQQHDEIQTQQGDMTDSKSVALTIVIEDEGENTATTTTTTHMASRAMSEPSSASSPSAHCSPAIIDNPVYKIMPAKDSLSTSHIRHVSPAHSEPSHPIRQRLRNRPIPRPSDMARFSIHRQGSIHSISNATASGHAPQQVRVPLRVGSTHAVWHPITSPAVRAIPSPPRGSLRPLALKPRGKRTSGRKKRLSGSGSNRSSSHSHSHSHSHSSGSTRESSSESVNQPVGNISTAVPNNNTTTNINISNNINVSNNSGTSVGRKRSGQRSRGSTPLELPHISDEIRRRHARERGHSEGDSQAIIKQAQQQEQQQQQQFQQQQQQRDQSQVTSVQQPQLPSHLTTRRSPHAEPGSFHDLSHLPHPDERAGPWRRLLGSFGSSIRRGSRSSVSSSSPGVQVSDSNSTGKRSWISMASIERDFIEFPKHPSEYNVAGESTWHPMRQIQRLSPLATNINSVSAGDVMVDEAGVVQPFQPQNLQNQQGGQLQPSLLANAIRQSRIDYRHGSSGTLGTSHCEDGSEAGLQPTYQPPIRRKSSHNLSLPPSTVAAVPVQSNDGNATLGQNTWPPDTSSAFSTAAAVAAAAAVAVNPVIHVPEIDVTIHQRMPSRSTSASMSLSATPSNVTEQSSNYASSSSTNLGDEPVQLHQHVAQRRQSAAADLPQSMSPTPNPVSQTQSHASSHGSRGLKPAPRKRHHRAHS
ncbi:hypothetical protein GQ42DRAFT_171738 [Ramicandelaber brevisporus]|nr:hypothetical protein GQ42DRAFT_171738 [Ramicandelaber brevisporus]